MCACDFNYTCPQCAGTPFDPDYENDEPVTPDEFAWFAGAREPSEDGGTWR